MERLRKLAHSHIKDAVYAANDGIVTTFAVVAGVVGASLEPNIILFFWTGNVFYWWSSRGYRIRSWV